MSSSIYVPPMGMAGWSQMTPASKVAQAGGRVSSRSGGTRRKRKSAASRTRKVARKKNGGRKLKFGTPAWRKKYMRKKRK